MLVKMVMWCIIHLLRLYFFFISGYADITIDDISKTPYVSVTNANSVGESVVAYFAPNCKFPEMPRSKSLAYVRTSSINNKGVCLILTILCRPYIGPLSLVPVKMNG